MSILRESDPGQIWTTQTEFERYTAQFFKDINYYQPLSAGDSRDFAPAEETDWTA
jgi:hypothetical protein